MLCCFSAAAVQEELDLYKAADEADESPASSGSEDEAEESSDDEGVDDESGSDEGAEESWGPDHSLRPAVRCVLLAAALCSQHAPAFANISLL